MDIIPPGIHTASRGLGIAMQYFQNACYDIHTKKLQEMKSILRPSQCFNLAVIEPLLQTHLLQPDTLYGKLIYLRVILPR